VNTVSGKYAASFFRVKLAKLKKRTISPFHFYSLNPTTIQTWIASILKTKAVCSSEMLVLTYHTTQCYTSDDSNIKFPAVRTPSIIQAMLRNTTIMQTI
jgi:hypothetical protein